MAELVKISDNCRTIPEMFFLRSAPYQNKPAIMFREENAWKNLTYAELTQKIVDLSVGFIGMGMSKGDKAAILSENRIEYYIAELALASCGAVAVPVYMNSAPGQIEYILKNSSSKFLLVTPGESLQNKLSKLSENLLASLTIVTLTMDLDPSYKNSVGQIIESASKTPTKDEFFRRLRSISGDDLATIIYTSGTSGDPKGVMLSHRNIISNAISASEILPIDKASVNISLLPLSHALEKTCSFYIFLFQGATIAICDNLNSLSRTLKEISPTHIIGVPKLFESIYQQIIKDINKKSAVKRKVFDVAIKSAIEVFKANIAGKPSRLSKKILTKTFKGFAFSKIKETLGGKLKLLISGGAPLPIEISEFFCAIGIPIIEGYGLTEAAPVVSCNKPEKNKPGSVGFPLTGIEVRIADDGEILVRGPNVMKGYYNNKEATGDTIDSGGWLHTGDIGLLDDEGYLKITGRKKDIIVTTGGKKIFPQNIESRIMSNPLIKQVIVLGEGRNFLSALIVPDKAKIESAAKDGLSPDINAIIDGQIKEINSSLSNYEKIRKYKILEKEFSIEDGEMTPTFKLRRAFIENKYADLIKNIYETQN